MSRPSTDLIRGVPFFVGLDDAAADRLASEFVERRYAPGEVILGQGQEGKSFFLVEEGSVAVEFDDDAGGSIPAAGGFFGELSLADREARRSATIRALPDTFSRTSRRRRRCPAAWSIGNSWLR